MCLLLGEENLKKNITYNGGDMTIFWKMHAYRIFIELLCKLAHNYCSTHANIRKLHLDKPQNVLFNTIPKTPGSTLTFIFR